MERKWGKRVFWGCAIGSLLAGGVIPMASVSPGPFFWQRLPFFSAAYGFVGCIVIIVASKALGHHWLQKREDYYGQDEKKGRESD
jgi:O-antigen/teichoic acid export membrane protein